MCSDSILDIAEVRLLEGERRGNRVGPSVERASWTDQESHAGRPEGVRDRHGEADSGDSMSGSSGKGVPPGEVRSRQVESRGAGRRVLR
ncbi:MAG: hypothetical protein JWM93_1474 [Frankiales bacterium]|nr:hypothetical protein [Frankiales bacterium]